MSGCWQSEGRTNPPCLFSMYSADEDHHATCWFGARFGRPEMSTVQFVMRLSEAWNSRTVRNTSEQVKVATLLLHHSQRLKHGHHGLATSAIVIAEWAVFIGQQKSSSGGLIRLGHEGVEDGLHLNWILQRDSHRTAIERLAHEVSKRRWSLRRAVQFSYYNESPFLAPKRL